MFCKFHTFQTVTEETDLYCLPLIFLNIRNSHQKIGTFLSNLCLLSFDFQSKDSHLQTLVYVELTLLLTHNLKPDMFGMLKHIGVMVNHFTITLLAKLANRLVSSFSTINLIIFLLLFQLEHTWVLVL